MRVSLSLRPECPYVTPVQQDDEPNPAVPIAVQGGVLRDDGLLPNCFVVDDGCCSHADRLTHSKEHVALFIFGDPLFDVGNKNYINTTTTTRTQANFWPYGETFFNYPTAEYAKLPLLRPYKQPGNNHQFSNGVNFASAGAGALIQTYQGLDIDLNMQLIYFKNVKKVLEQCMGETKAKKILSTAVHLFSIGSNDYIFPIMTNSSFFQFNSPEEYAKKVIGNITDVIKCVNSCGGKRGVKEYELCSNPSEYVFFDFGHPTEKAYEQLAQQMWSSTPSIVGPYNLESLFEQV